MSGLFPVDSIDVVPADRLQPSDELIWAQLNRSQRCYDVPSLRPEYTCLLAQTRSDVRVGRFAYRGKVVGFFPHVVDPWGRAFAAGQWLMSFQGAILDPRYTVPQDLWLSGIQARTIHFDRFVAPHAGFSASELCTAASPIIDMTQGYAGYREDLQGRGSHLLKRCDQKLRRAQRDFGSVMLQDESSREASLTWLLERRQQRNQQILAFDFLALPWTRRFVQALVQSTTPTFRGRLFVLRYGDRPVAALLGMQSGNTLECVLTAFDAHVSASSPGLLLFHVLCREAARMGIQRIHLTRGTEHYKERFENRIVTVSDAIVGASPWSLYWYRRSIWCQEWIRRTSWGPAAQRWVRRLRRLATHLPHGKLEKAWHDAVPGCQDCAAIESDSFLTVTTSARET